MSTCVWMLFAENSQFLRILIAVCGVEYGVHAMMLPTRRYGEGTTRSAYLNTVLLFGGRNGRAQLAKLMQTKSGCACR